MTTSLIPNPQAETVPQNLRADEQVLLMQYGEFAGLEKFEVMDNATYEQAGERLVQVKGTKKQITSYYEPIVRFFYTPYNAVTAQRKVVMDSLDVVEKRLSGQMHQYEAKIKAENARIAAENERLRLEDAKKAEAAKREAEEDFAPWAAAEQQPLTPVVAPPQAVTTLAIPTVAGLSKRKGQYKPIIFDEEKFIQWVLSDIQNRREYLPADLVGPALKIKTKSLGEEIGMKIPGVRAERGSTFVSA